MYRVFLVEVAICAYKLYVSHKYDFWTERVKVNMHRKGASIIKKVVYARVEPHACLGVEENKSAFSWNFNLLRGICLSAN